MPLDVEIFRLVEPLPARAAAKFRFTQLKARLKVLLPFTVDIEHVGATAIPNCLTKGDLDIAIRVQENDFQFADAVLMRKFKRNMGSYRGTDFAAFECQNDSLSTGLQLMVCGSTLDIFKTFRDHLRTNSTLVMKYNRLKSRSVGQSMKRYRIAKAAFVTDVLNAINNAK